MSQNLPPIKKNRRRKLKPFESQTRIVPILIGLLIALVGVGAAIAVVLAVSSQKDEPEAPVGIGSGESRPREEPVEPVDSIPQSAPEREQKGGSQDTRLARYSAGPPGYWSAKLPDGPGWSEPVDVPSETGQLFETRADGPDGAVAIVHYTPNERPLAGTATNVEPAGLPDFPDATVATVPGGTSVCPTGATCTDYLIPDQSGGGHAILIGWPGNDALAAELARRAAESFRP